jgi:hypothetical protein
MYSRFDDLLVVHASMRGNDCQEDCVERGK